jgi:hypothetical protein
MTVVVGPLLGGDSAFAARLIGVQFECDGQVVLETSYQDDGLPEAAAVWRYLGRNPIMAAAPARIVPNNDNPVRAELRGDVTISIYHASRLIARAKVPNLILVRGDASSTHWFLPADEVERTAHLAGIGPADSPASVWSWWISVAALAILSLSLIWFAIRCRYSSRGNCYP